MNSELTGAIPAMTEPSVLSPDDKHIVDVLIEERARHLLKRPRTWALIKRVIYPLLKYEMAIEMADAIADKDAAEVMEFVSQLLNVRLNVTGIENIPPDGRFMVTANHPTGIADGVAVYDAIKPIRPDMCFFANRDAIRVNPKLEDMIIPVEWPKENRTHARSREMVRAMISAFENERAVVIFPSGAPGVLRWNGYIDRKWETTFLQIAAKYNVALIPAYIAAKNSPFYYAADWLSDTMRNLTLFRELLNKRHAKFDIVFGGKLDVKTLPREPRSLYHSIKRHALSATHD